MQTPETRSDTKFSPEPKNVLWTIPNAISVLRILTIPVIAVLVSQRHLMISLVLIAVSAASDGVDGFIARRFNQVSRVGQILDPIADRMLILCTIVALGFAQILPWWLLVVVGLRDLVMGVLILILAQHGYGPLPVHYAGKTGTAMLMLAIPALILADFQETHFFGILHLVALAAVLWGVVLYWFAGVLYIIQGVGLIRDDSLHD
ncbi:MAG: CDP-alcohol phosphatidyltransferase family protein [Bifidobacterium crudilactis]|nr:CDP-alcohol phosphatidyltransferase family protein [Bifidobacterium crudilactis]